jgi:hypothetical protein
MSLSKPFIHTAFSYETLEETLDVKPKREPLMIGIPKETAFQENRVALTPESVGVLVNNGHRVVLEHNAGDASHFRDKDYSEAVARIVFDKRTCCWGGPSLPAARAGDHFSDPFKCHERRVVAEDDGSEDHCHFF